MSNVMRHEDFTEDSEYGAMQVVYLPADAKSQLNGDSGSWWEPIPAADQPSDRYPIKTVVPKSAVADGRFHPDRYEPDRAAEWCEQVSERELKATRPRRFRKGDRVRRELHGPGKAVTKGGTATVIRVAGNIVTIRDDADEPSPVTFDVATGSESPISIPGMCAKIFLAASKAKKKQKPAKRR